VNAKSKNTCILKGYDADVAGSAFHPTKDLVAVNVWEFDPEEEGCRIGFSNIRLFTGDGKFVRRLANANGGGAWLKFSPDGRSLAVANRNAKYTQLIDLKTGKEQHRFPGKGYSRSVDFHPSGKMIALLGPKHCQVWDTKSGKSIHTVELKNKEGYGEVLWSPNGDMLIVASNGKVTFLETGTWAKKHELELPYPRVSNVMLTQDGARLITVSWEQTWIAEEWMVESWGVN
jgi:WD40 repeat protein